MENKTAVNKTFTGGGSRAIFPKKGKRINVTLPAELADKLVEMAAADMRTLSSMTAIMVMRGMENGGV